MAEFDTLFGTSVQEAVNASIGRKMPLLVLLSRGDERSEKFIKKVSSEEVVNKIRLSYVPLLLIEDTEEIEHFKAIFKQLVLPSIYIVSNGQLLDIVHETATEQEIATKLEHALEALKTTPSSISTRAASVELQGANLELLESQNLIDSQNARRGESVSRHKKQVEAYKKEQIAERKRLRSLLEADKREREATSNKHNLSPRTAFQESKVRGKSSHNSDSCILSIKLLDGISLVHEFKASDTLYSVRNWLDQETNGEVLPSSPSLPSFARSLNPQPVRYVFHCPVLPRKTFSEDEERLNLSELDLRPRSALILKPIYEMESSDVNENGRGTFSSSFKYIGSSVGRLANALYSFFDYGVDDIQRSLEEDDRESISSLRVESEVPEVVSTSGNGREVPPPPGSLVIDTRRQASSSLINIHQDVQEVPDLSSLDSASLNEPNNRSRASTPNPIRRMQNLSKTQIMQDEARENNCQKSNEQKEEELDSHNLKFGEKKEEE
ncbi:uncharacterized protein PRCAT00004724001 [Priceomyces carsonii]|uniref:uncharacterized protein n=1 Tax=Priceomyces carsonii TaxID=28549 RepID=UPI002EDA9C31|nr:unnamed protein product [Priceomyces carsonii]